MNQCADLVANASAGAAPALRAIDCMAGEMTAAGFNRLFGVNGALAPALTILLTLYIAFFALSLLAGRSRLSIPALTPRMLTLGLVLTFATSWAAYQGVVWNLAIGAPDQLAGILSGEKGSATQLFADKLDIVFAAVARTAELAGGGQNAGEAAAAGGTFSPTSLMWLGALLLLLGTVGVLVTARIALAVLLAIGPVFIVLALFSGTRGLFVGWMRGVVLTAVTPLFVVTGGGLMLELLVPVLAGLGNEVGINGYAAMALFLIACVHLALMAMVLKVSGSMVSGWQVFGMAAREDEGRASSAPAAAAASPYAVAAAPMAAPASASRRTGPFASTTGGGGMGDAAAAPAPGVHRSRTIVTTASSGTPSLPTLPAQRARGIGSRFRAPAGKPREMMR